ncbi:DNA cytosine methyltransferase [Patescibacteria group bacterium]|nr:DNA cytosine methyltransferase [Patescibacteria group bacterium]MBU4057490.1 DNA cytosine methyltransferase [Patescibacteria group bacterium]MBU4116067.1 DNA cytosine methyltransferase [Patescibacteria group bacterium]
MKKKLKVVDLFCGVGGLSYGFAHDDNFEIVVANEILPNMAKAYSLNHPTAKVYAENIKDFNAQKIEKDLNIKASKIDIIVGGPPCQAYSTVGKRLIDDPRGKLFQEYYRVIKEFNPKLFLFENVRGLLSMQNGELLKVIISLFKSLGYKVQYKLLNAADFGTPQLRERVIIIGSKLKKDFHYPQPTHYNPEERPDLFANNLKPYLTLEEAINDLPFIKSGEESFEYTSEPQNDFQTIMRKNAPLKLMDHNSPNNNEKLVKIMELLPDGGTPEDLPENLRPTSGFKNTYCRLWWKRPATTITRNLSTPSSSRCIHPKAPRPLTTREGARIQCFPDNYQFYGSRGDKNLQIGNAVPTFLSNALAKSILENFKANKLI